MPSEWFWTYTHNSISITFLLADGRLSKYIYIYLLWYSRIALLSDIEFKRLSKIFLSWNELITSRLIFFVVAFIFRILFISLFISILWESLNSRWLAIGYKSKVVSNFTHMNTLHWVIHFIWFDFDLKPLHLPLLLQSNILSSPFAPSNWSHQPLTILYYMANGPLSTYTYDSYKLNDGYIYIITDMRIFCICVWKDESIFSQSTLMLLEHYIQRFCSMYYWGSRFWYSCCYWCENHWPINLFTVFMCPLLMLAFLSSKKT